MMYKLRDDGRHLIPVSDIESLLISDDQKAATIFRNVLIAAITTGKIKPRNSYGFQVDLLPYFQPNEDALDDLTDDLVCEMQRPQSITDFTKDVDPRKVRRWARNRMERDANSAIKDAALSGFLTQDDVGAFLGAQGIACEWVSIESSDQNLSLNTQQKIICSNGNSPPPAGIETNVIKLKRKALINELSRLMPSIERDLKDASRRTHSDVPRLSDLAKLGGGFWNVEVVMAWGKERGKIKNEAAEKFIRLDPESIFSATLRQLFSL